MNLLSDIVDITDLINIHHTLVTTSNTDQFQLDILHVKRGENIINLSGKNSIYMLMRNNYPVYLGRSINASSRTKNHLKDKVFDEIYIFYSNSQGIDTKTLQYIEFLCYYSLWSRGYCTIYNSQDVWNSLPLKSQKGPRLDNNEITFSHVFVKKFLESLKIINIKPPDMSGEPIRISYCGEQSIELNIIYWP